MEVHLDKSFHPALTFASTENDVINQVDEEQIADGSELIKRFLKDWASRTDDDGNDIVMKGTSTMEEELIQLKECFERYRPQFEANRWCENILNLL